MASCRLVWHESGLFWMASACNGRKSMVEEDPCEELVWDGEDGDTLVVVADKFVTFPFLEGEVDAPSLVI